MPWTVLAALAVHISTQSISKRDFLISGDIQCADNELIKNEGFIGEESPDKKNPRKKINYLGYL